MVESVGLVGDGAASDAVRATLGDGTFEPRRIDAEDAGDFDRCVVVGAVGADRFELVDDIADRWVAVELGGGGSHPLPGVDATISTFAPESACFRCLCTRIESHLEETDTDSGGSESLPPYTKRLAGALAAHRLHAWAAGETGPGTVLELPYSERRLFAVPDCSCPDGPDPGLERGHDQVGLGETVERAESTVDPRLGLIAEVGEAHSFPAPYYLAGLADTTAFSDARAGPHAAGVSPDWNAAYVKAVGEALERYAAGVYRGSAFETAPASGVTNPVSPSAFVLPEEGYATPDPDRSIAWIAGEELRSGALAHLPLEFVQYPPPESRHKPAITTGLGLNTDGIGALLSGLYEVIERDAAMLSWYSTFEPMELAVDSADFATLSRRARSENLSVTALLLTQDVDVPVVAVAVHRDSEWPKFALGSAADLRPAAAAENALCEALQNWMELREMGPETATRESTAIGRYAELPREARSFLDADATVPAASVGPDEVPDGRAELAAVLDRVEAVGLDAYAARLTTRDLATAGFEAVRVLLPAAQPLFTDVRYFGERAKSVPRDLGYRPRLDRPHHPFP